jgi:type IV pilus assembly protein PilB
VLALLPPLNGTENLLLVGAGSGYLAMILSRLVREITVIERNPEVLAIAEANLCKFAPGNLSLHAGEAIRGFPDNAPYDLIIASCELEKPDALLAQLKLGGNLYFLAGNIGPRTSLMHLPAHADRHVGPSKLGVIDFTRDSSEVLIDLGLVDEKMVALARAEAKALNQPVLHSILRHADIENINTYRALAERLGLRYAEAEEVYKLLDKHLFEHFSRTFLDHYRLLPVCLQNGRLLIASDNPDASTEALERMYPCSGVEKILVTSQDFRRLWSVLNISGKSGGYTQPPQQSLTGEHDETAGELENQVSPYLVAIYEAILFDAVSEKASDVHLEVYQQQVRIRLRVDGDLYNLEHYQLTPAELAGVVNVIKTRTQLDISEHRLPQGGRSRLRVGDTTYDLRVQTQPSLHGEHVVIRLLPQSGHALTLKQLGMLPGITRQYRRLLDNPSGLVLIVGPTGSGKTTTLSAGLQELADDGRRKVITVEDPIEYAIDNIQQTHVRTNIGFGFADAMRSFVRQDPDVILVGEIRDSETALEAVRASQTGHLVLSTLHCNDAVDAIQRLFDLGLHHNSLASELLAIMAQQLAKRICSHCREPAEPAPAILAELFPEKVPDNFRCFVGKGCPQCGGRGTKGRIAVVEFLQINSELRDVISRRPPLGELRWRALDAGLVTMRDSALELVLQGIIPLSELPRILPEERLAPEARGGNRSNP